jgi:cytochrome c peroxidase
VRHELVICSVGAGLWLTGCGEDGPALIDDMFSDAEWEKISRFTPLEAPRPSPTNRFADHPGAAALGQRLWFEKRYAGAIVVPAEAANGGTNGGLGPKDATGMISCADCHDPGAWFIDTRSNPNKVSLGASWTRRNSPSIVNAVYYDWVGWGGAHDQFWKQAAIVPESKESFNGDRLRFVHVVYEHYRDDYNALFSPPLDPALDPSAPDASRFPPNGKPKPTATSPDGAWEQMTEADRESVNAIMANVGKAYEAYERLLVSHDAPFDRYVAGDRGALTGSAKRGLKLFIGKAACDSCHQDQTFTDNEFHNTGVVQPGAPYDEGRFSDVLRSLPSDTFSGAGVYSDDREAGARKIAGIAQLDGMKGQFRTKSLRHVAETGPYFHDGSVATLEEVVRFYNAGGGAAGFPGTKDPRMVPLNLSEQEILDLVAFLEALTGDPVPAHLQLDTAAP